MRQQPDERWNGYPKDRGEEYEFIIIFGFDGASFLSWQVGLRNKAKMNGIENKKWVNGIKVRGE